MSSPKPLEDLYLVEAALAVNTPSPQDSHDVRLEVLEAAAAALGGWDLSSFREVFDDSEYHLDVAEATMKAESVVAALRRSPVHPSLALSRLAQPPQIGRAHV